MKVNGIIAEYNPFHNGHKYHLEASRLHTGADYTIIALSGNFMQRGTPAMIHKYARAEMALKNGADLVLEIPAIYACSSAEYYANGAVALLDKLGVTDFLCFGSECGNLATLTQIADILTAEPDEYREALAGGLKQGHSYPTARSMALKTYISGHCPSLKDAAEVFASPNNILGIEYIKALIRRNSTIRPLTIKRTGAQYHEQTLDTGLPSATAIRQAIHTAPILPEGEADSSFLSLTHLEEHLPGNVLHILEQIIKVTKPLEADDFSQILLYRLLQQEACGYGEYLDINSDLSDKIRKNLFSFRSFTSFCDLLKSKDTTYSRISRSLLHILLDIKTKDIEHYKTMDYVPYARVLGLRKDAAPLLSAIKEHSSIPLITKLADADNILSGDALEMLHRDIQISHIYNMVEASSGTTSVRNEYRTPIIVI